MLKEQQFQQRGNTSANAARKKKKSAKYQLRKAVRILKIELVFLKN